MPLKPAECRRDHQLFREDGQGAWEGHELVRTLRRWLREGGIFSQRYRIPLTDGMSAPSNGGWKCYRLVYVQGYRGKRLVAKLYDKLPPPPLTLGQRQRIEAALKALTGGQPEEPGAVSQKSV